MSVYSGIGLSGLYKSLRIFIGFFVVSVVILFSISAVVFRYYKATAKIVVINSVKGDKEASSEDSDKITERAMNTVAVAVKSPYFIDEVVKQLHLEKAFGKENAADKLQDMISVKAVRGTHIIDITVSSQKPELATQIANTTVKLVLSDFLKRRFSFEKDMVKWLADQSAAIRKEVEDAATQLREFNISIKASDIKLEYDSLVSQIKGLQMSLTGVKAGLKQAEVVYDNIKSKLDSGITPQDLPEVQADDSYREVKSEYLVVQRQIETMLEKYHPDHPDLANRHTKLKAAERMMDVRAQTIIEDARNNTGFFESKAGELEQVLQERENALRDLEKNLDQYTALLNNLKEKESLYSSLMENINKEVDNMGLTVWQVDFLDQAYLPVKKSKPSFWFIMFVSIATSFFVTIVYNILKIKGLAPQQKAQFLKDKQPKGMYIERVKEDS